MKRERRSMIGTLMRCLRLRCPACGQSSIVQRPFKIKDHCPSCDALFKREDGFFVGAIMANVVTTELLILVIYLACLPLMGAYYNTVITILLIMALLFPIAFYHHSWSAWLGIDYLLESLPKARKK